MIVVLSYSVRAAIPLLAVLAAGCSGLPVYKTTDPPTSYSVGFGAGNHEVLVGGMGVGTVMAVVDDRAFVFTVHHSIRSIDIVIERSRNQDRSYQSFTVGFNPASPLTCTASFSLAAVGPSVTASRANLLLIQPGA